MAAHTQTKTQPMPTPEAFVDGVSFGGFANGLTPNPGSPILLPTRTWRGSRGLQFARSGEGGAVEVRGGSVLVASRHGIMTVREFADVSTLAAKLPYVDYVVKGAGASAIATVLGRGELTKDERIMLTDADCTKLINPAVSHTDGDWMHMYDTLSPQFTEREEAEFSMAYRALQAIRTQRR